METKYLGRTRPLALQITPPFHLLGEKSRRYNHPTLIHHMRERYNCKEVHTVKDALDENKRRDIGLIWINDMPHDSYSLHEEKTYDPIDVVSLGLRLRFEDYNGLLLIARPEDGKNDMLGEMLDAATLPTSEEWHNTWVYDPSRDDNYKANMLMSKFVTYTVCHFLNEDDK